MGFPYKFRRDLKNNDCCFTSVIFISYFFLYVIIEFMIVENDIIIMGTK